MDAKDCSTYCTIKAKAANPPIINKFVKATWTLSPGLFPNTEPFFWRKEKYYTEIRFFNGINVIHKYLTISKLRFRRLQSILLKLKLLPFDGLTAFTSKLREKFTKNFWLLQRDKVANETACEFKAISLFRIIIIKSTLKVFFNNCHIEIWPLSFILQHHIRFLCLNLKWGNKELYQIKFMTVCSELLLVLVWCFYSTLQYIDLMDG